MNNNKNLNGKKSWRKAAAYHSVQLLLHWRAAYIGGRRCHLTIAAFLLTWFQSNQPFPTPSHRYLTGTKRNPTTPAVFDFYNVLHNLRHINMRFQWQDSKRKEELPLSDLHTPPKFSTILKAMQACVLIPACKIWQTYLNFAHVLISHPQKKRMPLLDSHALGFIFLSSLFSYKIVFFPWSNHWDDVT